MTNPLDYYATHDRWSAPGDYTAQLATLPRDLANLHDCINGLIMHVWKIRAFHPQLLNQQRHDVFTRRACNLLAHIAERDAEDWTVERPVEQRIIVDCRQFALLLCTILRERNVPARARCGFATYLEPTHAMDHWICEYWDAERQRWVMEDPDLQKHDVPTDQFITGAQAWHICRHEPNRADGFGFSVDAKERGLWTVRMNAVRDVATLNGFVSVSGDGWGLAAKQEAALTDSDLAVLDHATQLAAENGQFVQMRSFYEEHEELRVPAEIDHFDYVADQFRTVAWMEQL